MESWASDLAFRTAARTFAAVASSSPSATFTTFYEKCPVLRSEGETQQSRLVLWDLIGTLPLPLGVLGHEGSTVIVGLNGLRLLRDAAWNRAGVPAGDAR